MFIVGDSHYIDPPKIIEDVSCIKNNNKRCVWDSFEIKLTDNDMGYGVFTTRTIYGSIKLPYGGIEINQETKNNLMKSVSKNKRPADYISDYTKSNKFVNGHPNLLENENLNGPKHAWIGAMCNHNALNPTAQLILCSGKTPKYPFTTTKVFVQTFKTINAGTQITYDYGYVGKMSTTRNIPMLTENESNLRLIRNGEDINKTTKNVNTKKTFKKTYEECINIRQQNAIMLNEKIKAKKDIDGRLKQNKKHKK